MASTSQENDTNLEPEDKENPNLICNICSEQFREPKLLPCGHTYCLKCLKGIVVENMVPSNPITEEVNRPTLKLQSVITCPKCATEHSVPSKGVSSFLTDFTIVQEIEAHTWRICMRQKRSCGMCETVGKMEAFCTDCNSFLCSYCASAYKRMKTFLEHQVSPPDIHSLKLKLKPKVVFCQQHSTIVVNMYCVTCKEMICNECLCRPIRHSISSMQHIQYHHGHIVHPVTKEALAMFDTKVTQLVDRANKLQQTLEHDLQDIDTQEEKIKVHPDKLKKTVNDTVDSWIATMERARDIALRQIAERYAESLKKCQEEKEAISTRLKNLDSSIGFARKALECENQNGRYAMMSQAKSLLELPLSDCQKSEVSSNCSFFLVKTPRRESSSLSLLISCEQDISIGKISRVELGGKSTLEVHFNMKPLDLPSFRITYKGKTKRYCPLTKCVQKNKCIWELEFTPHCIGRYHVEAMVFGEWICSPPFSTSPLSQLIVGDVVRVSPDAPDEVLFSKSQKFETGKIKSINYSTSGSGRTMNYNVMLTWGHDSEESEDLEMNFSCVRNSYNLFPLELAL